MTLPLWQFPRAMVPEAAVIPPTHVAIDDCGCLQQHMKYQAACQVPDRSGELRCFWLAVAPAFQNGAFLPMMGAIFTAAWDWFTCCCWRNAQVENGCSHVGQLLRYNQL
jgi:hypothetical protein